MRKKIHKIKCKYKPNDNKCETFGIKYKYCDCFLEYTNFKDDVIEYKCLRCNNNYKQKFDEKLKEQCFNLIHTNFLTTTLISLFYFRDKVLIFINI